jgi:hypothetical protein
MNRRPFLALTLLALLIVVLGTGGSAQGAPVAASALTGYYNLLGYEGIGTLGSVGFTSGGTPPVGDYVTTHCRYIDVQNTIVGHYYLRYPLHLPNGAHITNVSLFVADFNPSGVLWAYLRSRPWNSREGGTTLGYTLTDNTTNNDKTINITGLNVDVNNQTTEYWIDVSPTNGTSPGQLCVYGIQVTYTIDGAFLPLVQKGYY